MRNNGGCESRVATIPYVTSGPSLVNLFLWGRWVIFLRSFAPWSESGGRYPPWGAPLKALSHQKNFSHNLGIY
jgi:hypothetical protein